MKASEAKSMTIAARKKLSQTSNSEEWNRVMSRIDQAASAGSGTIDVPKPDMTPYLMKKLKRDGYKVNCHPPEDPDDMEYVQVCWINE